MAINPNPVLEAFMSGRQQKTENDRTVNEQKFRQDQLQQQKEQFDAQLEELKSQHEREDARMEAAQNFTQSVQKLAQEQQIQEHYAKYGVAPSNSAVQEPSFSSPYQDVGQTTALGQGPTVMPIAQDLSGIPQGQKVITLPDGRKIPVISPTANAEQQAKVLDITQGPLLERQAAKEAQIQAGQMKIEQMKIDAINTKDVNDRKSKLEEIRLQQNLHNAGLLAAAKERGSSTKSVQEVDKILTRFQGSKVNQAHQVLAPLNEEIQAIPNNTKNPNDDTALVYAFAKAQDPNYAIRRGSISDIKDYAQTIAQKFDIAINRIDGNASFLTPKARAGMKKTIANKTAIQDKEYQLLKSDIGAQFKNLKEDPRNYLPSEFGPSDIDLSQFDPNVPKPKSN